MTYLEHAPGVTRQVLSRRAIEPLRAREDRDPLQRRRRAEDEERDDERRHDESAALQLRADRHADDPDRDGETEAAEEHDGRSDAAADGHAGRRDEVTRAGRARDGDLRRTLERRRHAATCYRGAVRAATVGAA